MKKKLLSGICFVLAAVFAAADTPDPFVVIVNDRNPAVSASPSMVSGLFLKRAGKWRNGPKSYPVDLVESSKIRDAFSRRILGRSTLEVEQYWQSAIFSGRDIPPPKKVTDAEVMAYVENHVGAIGYVSSATPLAAGVKVLQISRK